MFVANGTWNRHTGIRKKKKVFIVVNCNSQYPPLPSPFLSVSLSIFVLCGCDQTLFLEPADYTHLADYPHLADYTHLPPIKLIILHYIYSGFSPTLPPDCYLALCGTFSAKHDLLVIFLSITSLLPLADLLSSMLQDHH